MGRDTLTGVSLPQFKNMIDINTKGKGCIKQPFDVRDYRLEKIAGNFDFSFFSLRDKIIKVKDQGSSGSCVGQSFSYYSEILNSIETQSKIQLSARDVYSKIYLKESGAYLRDACKKLVSEGICLEMKVASYKAGNPPTEDFMRKRNDISKEDEEEGMTYWAKNYFTWNTYDWEMLKKAIRIGNGAVIGAFGNNPCWQEAKLEVPVSVYACPWAHAIYCTGVVKIDGKEYIEFVNSWGDKWGDNGFGYLPKEYVEKGFIFNCWTIVDRNNNEYNEIISKIDKIKFATRNLADLISQFKK